VRQDRRDSRREETEQERRQGEEEKAEVALQEQRVRLRRDIQEHIENIENRDPEKTQIETEKDRQRG